LTANWGRIRSFLSRGGTYVDGLREGGDEGATIPVVLASGAIGEAIFAGESAGITSPKAFSMTKTATVKTASRTETAMTQNVVALWEGRDPVLKNEMVAIGAHYDHVGTN